MGATSGAGSAYTFRARVHSVFYAPLVAPIVYVTLVTNELIRHEREKEGRKLSVFLSGQGRTLLKLQPNRSKNHRCWLFLSDEVQMRILIEALS
jgi:hypothetical protein